MPDEKPFNNPFENALRGLRDQFPAKTDTPQENVAKIDNMGPAAEEKVDAKPSPELTDKERQEKKEDDALWDEVVNILDINSRRSERHYWGVKRAIRESREFDTSYDINRWISNWAVHVKDQAQARRLVEISDFLLRRAYLSHVVISLCAATPEGMKYGRSSREERIQEARQYAKKIGVMIEDLIKEYRIPLDL